VVRVILVFFINSKFIAKQDNELPGNRWDLFTFHDERAMTGLEASVVLIAFVVVASVFAYVVIGSGMYASQKSREVINGAVDEVSAQMMSGGTVAANSRSGAGSTLLDINLTLRLPRSAPPVDLRSTTVRIITDKMVNNSVFFPEQGVTVFWPSSQESPPDMLLESGEIVDLCLLDLNIPPSSPVTIEVLPPRGAPISLTMTTPSHYDGVMSLER
jgi:flagellin FlaB